MDRDRLDPYVSRFTRLVGDIFETHLRSLREIEPLQVLSQRLDKKGVNVTIWEFLYFAVKAIPASYYDNFEYALLCPFLIIFMILCSRYTFS